MTSPLCTTKCPLKVVVIATDNRENRRQYGKAEPYFGTAVEALFQGLENMPGVELHVVSTLQSPVASPSRIATNIRYHGLFVPRSGWLRTGYRGCIRAVRQKLHEIKPDIVHGQGTERECALSAAYSGFPNVVTIHGNMARMGRFATNFQEKILFWLMARLERRALRRADGVFCNSTYTESLVKPYAHRIWRVPNALRLPFFSSLPRRPTCLKPVLLNIGTVAAHKQQVEILQWAEGLHEEGLQFELRFIGPVDESSGYGRSFAKKIAIARSAGYASHEGLRNMDELLKELDQARALIHCSQEESFGLVVAEAMARNLKFLGMSTGGVSDIASGVDGAELVESGNWSELRRRIRTWTEAGCPEPRHAAAVMRERYYPDVVARRHLEIYGEILDRSSVSTQFRVKEES